MASLFAHLERVAGTTVDAVFAEKEGFVLIPMAKTDVNARAHADETRPSYTFTAIFSCNGQPVFAEGRGRAENSITPMIAAPPSVDAFATAFSERPKLDWHVVRSGTGEKFRISEVMDREGGRLILALVRQQ